MKRFLCLVLIVTCTLFMSSCSSSSVSPDTSTPEEETNTIDVETEDEAEDTEIALEETVTEEVSSEAETEVSSENATPIMTGTYIEDFDQITKSYKMDDFNDMDFGDGTINRSFVNDDATLYLDVMYWGETHEVMNGEIVTAVLCPKDLQVEFIKDISQLLCPESSSEGVSKWVTENIGHEAEIDIDGFVYELTFGAKDNLCYGAGVRNWEDWLTKLN